MGIASLILGIISLIIGFVPLCGSIALLPAIIGVILGIIDISKKSKTGEKKNQSIAGLIMSAIAVVVIIFWIFVASGVEVETDSNFTNEYLENKQIEEKQTDNSSKDDTANQIKVGEYVKTNQVKITYISSNEYTGYNQYSAPKAGNKVIRLEFEFENISNNDVFLDSFECYADSEKCESYYYADDMKNPTLESLSKGKKFKSIIYYEVPKNAEEIILEYETNYWSDKKVEFIVK